ncbi:hypothetical protein HY218_02770 [Candidatus Saccharibacteria bacterium]|nr:hypothetical protein [Candidatus Saccharibacteria bacterium]
MANEVDQVEDPSPAKFWRLFIIVAIVLVIIGVIVLVLGKLVVGGIITVIGAIFGLGGQVAKNNKLK